jgi:hypothetical protein
MIMAFRWQVRAVPRPPTLIGSPLPTLGVCVVKLV